MMRIAKMHSGFTIIELLIVVVVIGILTGLTAVTYIGIQDRARTAKINSDLALFSSAVQAARINSGDVATRFVTGLNATSDSCMTKPAGTNFATLNHTTDVCWIDYDASLKKISDASLMNITRLVDPWGRPYVLDENEKDGPDFCGTAKDYVGVMLRPFVGTWEADYMHQIPYVTPGC